MAFPWLVREGLTLHKVRRLYLFWTEKANAWVDVSATVERKVEALRAHASQIEKPDELGAELRKWGAEGGARIGVAAAESFRVIVLDVDDAADAVAGSGDGASGAAAADPAGAAVPTGQA
jgi:LmbE family N-acetylglucosaminyl deacetylase